MILHRAFWPLLILGVCTFAFCGCNSLASLGLPFSAPNNRLLEPAERFSEQPGVALELPRELLEQPLADYPIEIGDVVLVEPVSFDATIRLPGDQVVKPDGNISLGEFGQFQAANKTVMQMQFEIKALIDLELERRDEVAHQREASKEYFRKEEASTENPDDDSTRRNAEVRQAAQSIRKAEARADDLRLKLEANRISVRLISWESKKIYVLGEVNSPGSFAYTGNQTVLDALVEAGGMTVGANRHKIIVARATHNDSCRIVLKTCYHQIVQLGDTSTNYQLMPGDRVFVPSLTFWEDVEKTFSRKGNESCPRCAGRDQSCYGNCGTIVQ